MKLSVTASRQCPVRDGFGTQTSAFCSVKTFQNLYFPYYKRVNEWVHCHTQWKTFKHSCGAVSKFLPSFIECGFDILNPVQCSATGMEPSSSKPNLAINLCSGVVA